MIERNSKITLFMAGSTVRYLVKAKYDSKETSCLFDTRGSFKNYVDKMRWVGGQKMLLFVHVVFECPQQVSMTRKYT